MVKEFPGEKYESVKGMLSKVDMTHSKESPLPQGWMSLDVKLGSLTLTLEENNFAKGVVD